MLSPSLLGQTETSAGRPLALAGWRTGLGKVLGVAARR